MVGFIFRVLHIVMFECFYGTVNNEFFLHLAIKLQIN